MTKKLAILKRHPTAITAVAVVLTLIAVAVAVNFIGNEKKIERHIERLYGLDDPRFQQELGVMLGPQFVAGNGLRVLRNGDEIFPAMLAAIRAASRTITFESYIYWSGDIGREFAQALAERARSGVKVHVLLDWVGSAKMDGALLDSMSSAGVQIHKFHPPHWSQLGRLNNRTHRKLLVVDGRIGFTGGVGIAPLWTGTAQDPEHWRDTHFQVEGPVVAPVLWVLRCTGPLRCDTHAASKADAAINDQQLAVRAIVDTMKVVPAQRMVAGDLNPGMFHGLDHFRIHFSTTNPVQ